MTRILSFVSVIAASLLMHAGSVIAQNIQCLEIQDGSINQLELRKQDGHENCFYLEGGSTLNKIRILSTSSDLIRHEVSFVSFEASGLSSATSTSQSDNEGSLTAEITVGGRNLAFGVKPTTLTQTNKHLSVTYYRHGDLGIVILDLEDVPPPKPPIEEPPLQAATQWPAVPLSEGTSHSPQ